MKLQFNVFSTKVLRNSSSIHINGSVVTQVMLHFFLPSCAPDNGPKFLHRFCLPPTTLSVDLTYSTKRNTLPLCQISKADNCMLINELQSAEKFHPERG